MVRNDHAERGRSAISGHVRARHPREAHPVGVRHRDGPLSGGEVGMRPQVRLLLGLSLAATVLVPLAGPVSAGNHPRSGPAGSTAVLDWNATATTAAARCGLTDAPPIEAR